MSSASDPGILYIVPTPIGNLGDISERACAVLAEVQVIAAEDTRHSGKLLSHLGIKNDLLALHEHNERDRSETLIKRLQAGESIALISDAGTPLISDPGYVLVGQCRRAGIKVVALPGACAITTALSASGLATDRFCFEGFLPAKPQQRRKRLQELLTETRTLVFYESPHRIVHTLEALHEVFGEQRGCVMGRELTKQFETYLTGTVAEVLQQVTTDSNQQRGEIVLMLAGAEPAAHTELPTEALYCLKLLSQELPLKKAAAIVAEVYGLRKNQLYEYGLQAKNE